MNKEPLKARRNIARFPAYNVPFQSTILPHIYPPNNDPAPNTIVIVPANKSSFLFVSGRSSIIYDE
jgi:hypothetical protein